jgi:hypothetical protein
MKLVLETTERANDACVSLRLLEMRTDSTVAPDRDQVSDGNVLKLLHRYKTPPVSDCENIHGN